MATSSITGTHDSAGGADDDDTSLLGPSDNSDSGSDTLGQRADLAQPDDNLGGSVEPLEGGSDASGTGERAAVEGDAPPDGADILPDRIIGPGGGATDADEVHARSGSLAADDDDDEADDEA